MFELIGAALKVGKVAEWVALGLGLVLLFGAGVGVGMTFATKTCVTAQAKVTVRAQAQAASAQSDKDAKDYDQGVKDGNVIGKQQQAAADAASILKAKYRANAASNPPKPGCPLQVIPAAMIEGLNDPKLIGGGE